MTSLLPSRVSRSGRGAGRFSAFDFFDTASSPLPPVEVKPAGEEGRTGQGFDVLDVLGQCPLGGFEPLPLGSEVVTLRLPAVAVGGLHPFDEQGDFPAPPVLGRDPAAPADALVGVGTA